MTSLRDIASVAYGTGLLARNRAYDLGLCRAIRVEGLRVVSVGGLTVGGSGKTPMTLHVAETLHRRGVAVAIISRGYRGSWERKGGLISDGSGRVLASVAQAGDEAMMMALRCPEIPVIVGANRVAAALGARSLGARAVVLDSGFQHRRLARDLDLVAIASETTPESELIPRGTAREPFSALARADLIAVLVEGAERIVPFPSPSLFFRLKPDALVGPRLEQLGEVDELRGRRVLLVAGIARPERLAAAAGRLGAVVRSTLWFSDHHDFSRRDRRRIEVVARTSGAELVVTTEKDLVRLGNLDGVPLVGLRVSVSIGEGGERLERLLM